MQVPDPAVTPTLRVEEVAALLHISRTTAYMAVNSGEIPCLRIGKRVVVPTAPILEMLGLGPRVQSREAAQADDAGSSGPSPSKPATSRIPASTVARRASSNRVSHLNTTRASESARPTRQGDHGGAA